MNSGGTSTFQDPYVGPYVSYDQDLSNDMSYVGVGLVPGIDYVIPYQPYGTIYNVKLIIPIIVYL